MLTAPSIKPVNVLSDLEYLEARFRAVIKTAQGDSFKDVLMHSTCPTEKVIEYEKHVSSEFHEKLVRKVNAMINMVNEWPLDETSEGLSERRNEKQPKIQKKFTTICKEFIYQLGSLGMVLNACNQSIHIQSNLETKALSKNWSIQLGSYGGILANLAAIVDLELKKREACTTPAKWVSRTLITCKLIAYSWLDFYWHHFYI